MDFVGARGEDIHVRGSIHSLGTQVTAALACAPNSGAASAQRTGGAFPVAVAVMACEATANQAPSEAKCGCWVQRRFCPAESGSSRLPGARNGGLFPSFSEARCGLETEARLGPRDLRPVSYTSPSGCQGAGAHPTATSPAMGELEMGLQCECDPREGRKRGPQCGGVGREAGDAAKALGAARAIPTFREPHRRRVFRGGRPAPSDPNHPAGQSQVSTGRPRPARDESQAVLSTLS